MKLRLPFALLVVALSLAACNTVSTNRPASMQNSLPSVVYQTVPQYPLELRRAGSTGSAVVDFIVTSTGDVVSAYAISATAPGFGFAAAAAVSRWKFKPALRNGRPVNVHMQLPIGFTFLPVESGSPASK
ncbi:MAG: TonB family protein [Opitutaceae bacterium]